MIITVTLNPALDKTLVIPGFALDAVNRAVSGRLDAGGKGVNVSKVLKSLGADSLAMGFLGGVTGTMIAAEAPATTCPAMTHSTVGPSSIMSDEPANVATTIRKISPHPIR